MEFKWNSSLTSKSSDLMLVHDQIEFKCDSSLAFKAYNVMLIHNQVGFKWNSSLNFKAAPLMLIHYRVEFKWNLNLSCLYFVILMLLRVIIISSFYHEVMPFSFVFVILIYYINDMAFLLFLQTVLKCSV